MVDYLEKRVSFIERKKGVGRQHTTFTSCKNAACSSEIRLCSGEFYALTEQMWFLRSCQSRQAYWLSAVIVFRLDFALWYKSIFFELFWNVNLFFAPK